MLFRNDLAMLREQDNVGRLPRRSVQGLVIQRRDQSRQS